METTRFILILAVGLVIMMLIQKWEEDYGQTQETSVEAVEAQEAAPVVPDLPVTPQEEFSVLPDVKDVVEVQQDQDGFVTVITDVFELRINKKGGGLAQAKLLKYPAAAEIPDQPFVLMDNSRDLFYVFQGGVLSKQASPNHETLYQAERDQYLLTESNDSLQVPLTWVSNEGVRFTKVYRFQRDSYEINVEYRIENNSEEKWQGRAYGQLQRTDPNKGGHRLIYTYTGAVVSSPEQRYEKISFDDMEDKALGLEITDGWAAMLQHYFITALLPSRDDAPYHYYTKAIESENRYLIGFMTPAIQVESNSSSSLNHRLYVGPKYQSILEKIAPRLELTVDYGVLWFIAKPLFWCLEWFHGITNNWGWAILLVTLSLKIVFYPLSSAGYRSMANMRRVQPRLLAMRERYKKDKARLNQAMMELYKEEKINPLGGCFPILIQIPVFIALYWVLLESVEMRQAPFLLWIQDLSSPDPFFVLPVVMGVTMFIQQKLNPAPMDPVQEKVMMMLPLVFTVFFAFFPSGLVLYWVANNVLSIAQQWLITTKLEKAGLK